MSNSKAKAIPITQPGDWWEAFKAQASLEGLPLSEWVGQACLVHAHRSLPGSQVETCLDINELPERLNLSPRAKRGRVSKSKEAQQ